MYEKVSVKEQIFNEIKTSMQPLLSSQQLDMLMFVVSKSLNSVNIIPKSDLLSTEVINNDKLIQNFIISKKIEGLSTRSLIAYKYTINKMVTDLNVNIVDIDSNTIRYYLLEYSKHASNVTVDNVRRNLNSFFSWLTLEGYISSNPIAKIKKVKCEKKIKTPLTTTEVQGVKDSCDNIRDIVLVNFMCSTGCRCEEITKVKIYDVDFEKKSVRIYGKGNKQRNVFLDDICYLHITQYIQEREENSGYLFCNKKGNKISTEGLSFIIRKLGNEAKVKNCQIHRFRKYFATTLFNRGCDVVYIKQLLGHEKLDTTMIYVQTSSQRVVQEFQHFAA